MNRIVLALAFVAVAIVLAGFALLGRTFLETRAADQRPPEASTRDVEDDSSSEIAEVQDEHEAEVVRSPVALPEDGLLATSEESTGALRVKTALADGTCVPGIRFFVTLDSSEQLGRGTTEHFTDEEGTATISGLPLGSVSLFCPNGSSEEAEIVAGQVTEVLLELEDLADIRGIVRGPTGQPVAGADVWVVSWRRDWLGTTHLTRTDSDGTFHAPHVHRHHSIGATAESFAPSALVDLELVSIEDEKAEIELVLEAGGGGLVGQVVDPGGRPMVGARVAVGHSPSGYSNRNDGTHEEQWCVRVENTDESGNFTFTGLATGRQPLHVAADSYPIVADEVEIPLGRTVRKDVRLVAGSTVKGTVSQDSGEVVAQALVLALDEPFVDPFPTQGPTERGVPFHRPATRSDAAGQFRLSLLMPGTVHLYASRGTSFWDGGKFVGTTQQTLELAAGETLEWNPILSRGRSIRGRVVYADERPMVMVFVSATDEEGHRFTENTGNTGSFEIPGLEDRAYQVSVQLWNSPDDAGPLEQEDVWPSSTELVLRASYTDLASSKGTVRARVEDRAGRIEGKGGMVFAYDRGWYFSSETDGVFQTQLPAGRYQARVMSGDTVVGSGQWFDLSPGEDRDLGVITTRASAQLVVRVRRPPALLETTVMIACHTDETGRTASRSLPPGEEEMLFEGLLEGRATVKLSGAGVAIESRVVELHSGAPTKVDLEVVSASSTAIHVSSTSTKGFGKLTITVRRAGGESYCEFENYERWGAELPVDVQTFVPVGHFTVEAFTSNGLAASESFEVSSLETTTRLELVLQ